MPEILTESFCERCGTRYTFQSAAPKVGRLAKMKVLSRGLKNYVLSDDTSLDEALADARSVDDREQSVEQLDAFHKTFNFCMSCRQYTCANCWNDREGRCFSCAPSLSVGLLPSASPTLAGGLAGIAGNGHGPAGVLGEAASTQSWPQTDLGIAPDDGVPFTGSAPVEDKPLSRLEALFGREAAAKIEAGTPSAARSTEPRELDSVPEMIGLEAAPATKREAEPVAAEAEPEAVAEAEEPEVAGEPVPDAVLTLLGDEPGFEDAILAAEDETEPVAATADTTDEADERDEEEAAAAAALAPEPLPVHPVDPETDELAAAAAAQTHGLLDKFRARPAPIPGPQPTLPLPAAPRLSVPIVPASSAPTTPPPAIPAPAQLPYAAIGQQPQTNPAMPQPFGAIGRPAVPTPGQPFGPPIAMPYAAQAPQAYGTPPGLPAATPYLAPDAPIQPYPAPATPRPASTPAMYPPFRTEQATPAPPPAYTPPPPPAPSYVAPQTQYAPPPAPSWRMVAPESPYLAPAAGNGHIGHVAPPAGAGEPEWPTTPTWPAPLARGAEAVWAESTRDLLNRPEAGVSACFNCGLPLSATARFCRRCGTNQVAS